VPGRRAMSGQSFGRFSGAGIDLDLFAGLLALAALIAIPMVGTIAALGFLVAGLGLLAMRPGPSLRDMVRFWPLLALPAFATASMLWSNAPAATLRFGLQLSITMVVAVVLARRLRLPHFLLAVFFVLSAVVSMAIVAGNYRTDTGALLGFYASKNAMGQAAALLALVALGLVRRFGVVAFSAALIAGLAVVLSQSVSATLALGMALASVIALKLLRPFRPLARAVACAFCLVGGGLVVVLAAANFDALAAAVLALTGKDVTLTGRTDLWQVALAEIAERPLLGQGYQAFWLPGNPTAEVLWEAFGIEAKTGFHFHNTYLSNAVELGLIGAIWQTGILGAAFWLTAKLAMIRPSLYHDILFGLVAMIVVLTPVEVPVFFQFNLTTLLLVCALVYAKDGLTAAKASGRRAGLHPPGAVPRAYRAGHRVQSAAGVRAG